MKSIVVIFFSFCFCYSQVPTNIDSVVYFQMLLLRSKMDIDPIVWQDTREGYLRNRTMRVCDRMLDAIGQMETDRLVEKYYPVLDSLITKVSEAKGFKLEKPLIKNYQFNYFYSSSSKP